MSFKLTEPRPIPDVIPLESALFTADKAEVNLLGKFALVTRDDGKSAMAKIYYSKALQKNGSFSCSQSLAQILGNSQNFVVTKMLSVPGKISKLTLAIDSAQESENYALNHACLPLILNGVIAAVGCYIMVKHNIIMKVLNMDCGESMGRITSETRITTIITNLTHRSMPSNNSNLPKSATYLENSASQLLDSVHLFLKTSAIKSMPQIRGYLLHGPQGSGKTSVAKTVASLCRDQLMIGSTYIRGADLGSSVRGEGESKFLKIFCSNSGPHIVILDNLDEMIEYDGIFMVELLESVFTQPSISWLKGSQIFVIGKRFIILGITSRFELIPPRLRVSPIFLESTEIQLPNHDDRIQILKSILSHQSEIKWNEFMFDNFAKASVGCSLSDLGNIVRQAVLSSNSANELLSHNHMLEACKKCTPANLSGINRHVPEVTFDSLFGIDDIIVKLKSLVLLPFLNMDRYKSLGIMPPKGLLIYGPSGVGKTLIASALIKESGISCIYADSAGIRSKIVGESEQMITDLLFKARSAAPCILLMDQFDRIMPRRGSSKTSEGSDERIVTSFLTEMDGIFSDSRKAGVFIIGGTLLASYI